MNKDNLLEVCTTLLLQDYCEYSVAFDTVPHCYVIKHLKDYAPKFDTFYLLHQQKNVLILWDNCFLNL